MKKALRSTSYLSGLMGFIAISVALLGVTDNVFSLIICGFYVMASPLLFFKMLSSEERKLFADRRITASMGKSYWVPIAAIAVTSIFIVSDVGKIIHLSDESSFLLALGATLISVAFIKPRLYVIPPPEVFE